PCLSVFTAIVDRRGLYRTRRNEEKRSAKHAGEIGEPMRAMNNDSEIYALILGQTVFFLREKHSFSQQELAARVGLSQSSLSRIERGKVQADAFLLRKFAAAFEIEVSFFLELIESSYRRAEQAAKSASKAMFEEKWWQMALRIAGLKGVAGLVAFSVGAVL